MSEYLKSLENGGVIPNFYCSLEYFKRAKFQEESVDGYRFWKEGDWIISPPLNMYTNEPISISIDWMDKVWSDFPGWVMPGLTTKYFLDHEYIYNPKDFVSMDGGKWQIFRKNCRKFPRRFQSGLTYDWIQKLYDKKGVTWVDKELEKLMIEWLGKMRDDITIQDDDTIVDYLFKGCQRKALWTNRGEVFAINIWDFNYRFINFRYCFCKNEDFLSEYIRHLFYTDPDILKFNKLVNDGGTVNNPNLKKFKDKLNPIQVREVYSWGRMYPEGVKTNHIGRCP